MEDLDKMVNDKPVHSLAMLAAMHEIITKETNASTTKKAING